MVAFRALLEQYIESHPSFLTSLEPLKVKADAPEIVQEMAEAAHKAGVGPMAAVAGAIAEGVGRELMKYSPEVIVGDARRHGVQVLPVDINRSEGFCTVQDGMVRLGFRCVKEMGEVAIARLIKARTESLFTSLADFYRRTRIKREAIDKLILAGAMECFGAKRQLVWDLGILEQTGRHTLMLDYHSYQVPLAGMTDWEEVAAEYSVQGLSARTHPMQIIREALSEEGILKSSEVLALSPGSPVRVAGYVVCRQAPRTAKGHVFLTLEDETGLVNVIFKPEIYQKYRYTARREPLVLIEGVFQHRDGISNIVAESITSLKRKESDHDPVPLVRNFC